MCVQEFSRLRLFITLLCKACSQLKHYYQFQDLPNFRSVFLCSLSPELFHPIGIYWSKVVEFKVIKNAVPFQHNIILVMLKSHIISVVCISGLHRIVKNKMFLFQNPFLIYSLGNYFIKRYEIICLLYRQPEAERK